MFTERQIRESRCYGKPEGFLWVHPANKAIWPDGQIIETTVPERESDSDRLTPDEAVRLLRERGVIEDEPVAFKVGDRVEVVGPLDEFWFGYVYDLKLCVGRVGTITSIANGLLVDFGAVQWNFPAASLRHAKAEAAPAQPDKWEHLPKGGEWVHRPSAACIYHATALTHEEFDMDGLSGGVARIDRFVLAAGDTTMTRAEAIALFESNAVPSHPDKWAHLPTDGEWTKRNDDEVWHYNHGTLSVLGYVYCNDGSFDRFHTFTAGQPHASPEETLITRAEAIAIFEANASPDHIVDANKMVSVQLSRAQARIAVLEQQLADARSSEGVTGARLATAEATIADLRRQLAKSEDIYDELMCLAKKKDRTIADLRISHARYEFVRTLTPMHFDILWQRCLRGDKFDAVVDDIILERAKAVKNDAR